MAQIDQGSERVQVGAMARALFVVCVIAICAATPHKTERIGDRLQVFLPVAALVCAVTSGQATWLVGRYLLVEVGIKVPKVGLGEAWVNQRPNGGDMGFPSGHTAAASFGATVLVTRCFPGAPMLQATAVLAAGFTGASRVEADAHYLWQTLAGALLGLAGVMAPLGRFDRLFARAVRRVRP